MLACFQTRPICCCGQRITYHSILITVFGKGDNPLLPPGLPLEASSGLMEVSRCLPLYHSSTILQSTILSTILPLIYHSIIYHSTTHLPFYHLPFCLPFYHSSTILSSTILSTILPLIYHSTTHLPFYHLPFCLPILPLIYHSTIYHSTTYLPFYHLSTHTTPSFSDCCYSSSDVFFFLDVIYRT